MAESDPERAAAAHGVPLEGPSLTDTGDRRAGVWLAVVVVGGVVVAVALFVALGAVAGLIALAVTAIVAAVAYRRARVWAHWENPQLFFPSSSSLRLGEEAIVRFRRQARRSGGAEGSSLTARLQCIETVRYRSGTDIHTATETVWDALLPVRPHHTGDLLDCDLHVTVPVFDAPPTMVLPHNRVSWRIVVHIESPAAPDDDSTFAVVVGPEVAL